ncbi:MAG: conjugal transfer pilus assembly protein TraV [Oleiphilaceae bacterium]|jgi:conjugal transfer pilus assembly protein TraV
MMNKFLTLSLLAASVSLTGCVSSIGKEEFTCSNMDKGGVCAGPRDIYELTNNRDSLENLSVEDLHSQVHGHQGAATHTKIDVPEPNNVYVERGIEQQGQMNYARAELAPTQPSPRQQASDFNQWPHNGEPLAPEALAMMEEPKPMRIMVNSFTDANGVFHVPGYLFVNTQKETWIKGSASNLRPTRVVPLELRAKSQQGMERIDRQRQGVSPLGVVLGNQPRQDK